MELLRHDHHIRESGLNSRLIAGPWVGEFGWELMSWQGYVRALAAGYKETFCFGPEGHQALYADFAAKYIPVVNLPGVKDCWWVEGARAEAICLNKVVHRYGGCHRAPHGLVPIDFQSFIRFGDPSKAEARYDVLFHIRGPAGKRKNHAWDIRMAGQVGEKLLEEGYRGAVIGTKEDAGIIYGFDDLRGVELKKLMDMISASRVVVGPSSGPMHLASLCGAAHVVWTDKQYYCAAKCTNRMRYETVWNPLKTRVEVIDEFGWNPPVDEVMERIKKFL